MSRKDIGKVLVKGSIRQKLLLLADDIARGRYFQERLLTEDERIQIERSIKSPRELKLYEDFREIDETLTNAITNLQGLSFEVLMQFSNLRGYILLWNAIESSELLVNSVLHEIKDPEERKEIAKRGAGAVSMLFTNITTDAEGYVDIKIDFEKESYSTEEEKYIKTKKLALWTLMSGVREQAEKSAIRYISWEKAILDFMEEKNFNVIIYHKQLENLGSSVYSPIIGWRKYSGEIATGFSQPRVEALIKRYGISVDATKLQVDKDIYNWFKKYFLSKANRYPEELRGRVNKKLDTDEQYNEKD
jgi:hypothetical protein